MKKCESLKYIPEWANKNITLGSKKMTCLLVMALQQRIDENDFECMCAQCLAEHHMRKKWMIK